MEYADSDDIVEPPGERPEPRDPRPDMIAAAHACNVVRRKVLEEHDDLTLLFIVHKTGGRTQALQARKRDIAGHPAGAKIMPVLEQKAQKKADRQTSALAGYASAPDRKFFTFMARPQKLVCFFLNIDHFETLTDLRHHAHNLVWRAMNFLDQVERKEEAAYSLVQDVFVPRPSATGLARQNLFGDVFAAFLMEIEGQRGMLKGLARQRCLYTISPHRHYDAEQYPMPIAIDAAQIVYEEMMPRAGAKVRAIEHALRMTEDVAAALDDKAILRWQDFSRSAQEMAWMNIDKAKILGAAVYTSEDPYIRSIAYLVAETLAIQPVPDTDHSHYNTFTDQEVNERHHHKACEEVFQDLITRITQEEDLILFYMETFKCNQRFLEGRPVGWCGYGLMKAAEAFETYVATESGYGIEEARKAFHAACGALRWEHVRDASRLMIDIRRRGLAVTPYSALEAFTEDERLSVYFAEPFKISLQQGLSVDIAQREEVEQMSARGGGIMDYFMENELFNRQNDTEE